MAAQAWVSLGFSHLAGSSPPLLSRQVRWAVAGWLNCRRCKGNFRTTTSLPLDFGSHKSNLSGRRLSLAGLALVVAGSPGDVSLPLRWTPDVPGVAGAGDAAGSAGAAAGRPLRGGAAGAAAASPVCGFSRSTVTICSTPPTSMWKTLGPFLRIM